jgi:hypothetical protein
VYILDPLHTNSGKGTSTQDIGGWQEKNCCCSEGTLGEDQGSKEIEADTAIRVVFNHSLLSARARN